MNNPAGPSLSADLTALRDWWLMAGVDSLYFDQPQRLLAEPSAASATRPGGKVAPATPGQPRDHTGQRTAAQTAPRAPASAVAPAPAPPVLGPLPSTLAAFRQWWLEHPLPFAARGRRIAPSGQANAPLLMLVGMPELTDTEQLLSGPQGRMMDNIARALGLDPVRCYRAAAMPAPIKLPDWDELAEAGMAQVLHHHLELAQPERILVFGREPAQVLSATSSATQTSLDLGGRQVPVLATLAPDLLLANSRRRRRLWQALLEWIPA